MIQIKVKKENTLYQAICIKGHSGYDISGKDIVCAGVSSIVITSINAIMRMDEKAISYNQAEGLIEINIKKHTKEVDILMENMMDLLKELQEQYSNYIKIYE